MEDRRMTTIYTDCLAALHAHLDAHPADWQARLVLADLLTDLDDEQGAACQRWMVEWWRCPLPHHVYGWHWWRAYHLSASRWMRLEPCDYLPYELHDVMPRWTTDTRQSAEAALLAALVAAGEI